MHLAHESLAAHLCHDRRSPRSTYKRPCRACTPLTYSHVPGLQVALQQSAAQHWEFIIAEGERRKQLLVDEEIRAQLEKAKPRSQKKRAVKPWVGLQQGVAACWGFS